MNEPSNATRRIRIRRRPAHPGNSHKLVDGKHDVAGHKNCGSAVPVGDSSVGGCENIEDHRSPARRGSREPVGLRRTGNVCILIRVNRDCVSAYILKRSDESGVDDCRPGRIDFSNEPIRNDQRV